MTIPFDTPACLTEAALDRREKVCRELLASSGDLAMEGFLRIAGRGAAMMKGPQDYLTEYDRLVEDHIRARLQEEFPDDGFLGEESGLRLAPRMWVVDPIDGTANFARGIPHFAISIAFVEAGSIMLGGIANPALKETYFARRGRGAERNGHLIRAAQTTRLDQSSVEFGWSNRIPNEVFLQRYAALLDAGTNVRRSAAGALGLAFVADGRLDAYVELHINAWDCLAGVLLAEEAGARTNAFLDNDGLLRGNPIIAVAPGVAEAVSQAVGIALADAPEVER